MKKSQSQDLKADKRPTNNYQIPAFSPLYPIFKHPSILHIFPAFNFMKTNAFCDALIKKNRVQRAQKNFNQFHNLPLPQSVFSPLKPMTSTNWHLLPAVLLEATPPPPEHTNMGLISPEFSSPTYNKENTLPLKRTLTNDSASTQNGPTTKKTKLLEAPDDFQLPDPLDMPVISFKSSNKPPFSYANMIGMALLRAPARKLTLAEIYDWIANHFSYYERGQVGWQNSIRHNLSLNKAFQKTEKSKDKKGHFWQIAEGREYMFCNIKESKRNGNLATNTKKVKKLPSDDSSDFSSDDSRPNTSIIPIPSTPISKTSSSTSFDDNIEITPKSSPINFKTPITSHNINLLQSSPMIFDSPIANLAIANAITHPNIQISGSQNLDFTCSFSSTNFEMSPMGPIDQGPILEPITPQRCQKVQLPSIHQQLQSLHHHPKHNGGFKTPLMGTTPLNGKRHLWASPSYLEEFLLSPISKNHHLSASSSSPVKLNKKFGNSYSSNEIFGIDICSINNHDDDVTRLK